MPTFSFQIQALGLLLALAFLTLGSSPVCAENLRIVDQEGRSQSVAELQPDGKIAVKVFVTNSDQRGVAGITVNLLRLEDGKPTQSIASAKTLALGAATFFDIPAGEYQVQVGCDLYAFDFVTLQNQNPDNESDVSQAELEEINIEEESGTIIASSSVEPGALSNVTYLVSTPGDRPQINTPVRLIEIENGIESQTLMEGNADQKGMGEFSDVPAGNYRLRVECQYRLGSVAFEGNALLGIVCPGALGSAPVSLFSSGLGGSAATGSVSASAAGGLTTVQVAGVAVGGAAAAGAAGTSLSSGGGKEEPTPTAVPVPTAAPTKVPTTRPTARPTRTPIPTVTIPGLAPTCPPDQEALSGQASCRRHAPRRTPSSQSASQEDLHNSARPVSPFD